jgi:hypothetical protein
MREGTNEERQEGPYRGGDKEILIVSVKSLVKYNEYIGLVCLLVLPLPLYKDLLVFPRSFSSSFLLSCFFLLWDRHLEIAES